MTETWGKVVVACLAILSDLAVICGTAYIVFWRGQSGWWFLLTLCFMTSVKWKK